MGTWGTGIFENDDASDFVSDVVESSELTVLQAPIQHVLTIGPDYLEAPDAQVALAAAAILARLKVGPSDQDSVPKHVNVWADSINVSPDPQILATARQGVQRVLAAPSEIIELWSATPEFAEWHQKIMVLLSKL